MSETFWRAHGLLKTRKLETAGLVDTFSVNGDLLPLLGSMEMRIKLGMEESLQTVLVVKQLPYPVLLGWDIIQRWRLVINGGEGFL